MKKTILLVITILLFALGHEMLIVFYPEANSEANITLNYDEFIVKYEAFNRYYYAKEILNEAIFTLMFFIIFMFIKCRVFSSIAVFGFTLAFCSFLDKAIFSNYGYLISDIVVVLIALVLSIKVYKNGFRIPHEVKELFVKILIPVNCGNISKISNTKQKIKSIIF